MDERKSVFAFYTLILTEYKKQKNPTININSISFRFLTEIINSQQIEKILGIISTKFQKKITKKQMQTYLEEFYTYLKSTASPEVPDNSPMENSEKQFFNHPKTNFSNASGGNPPPPASIQTQSYTITDPAILRLIDYAPTEEKPLFVPVICSYLQKPTARELVSLNKIIDRYKVMNGEHLNKRNLIPYVRPTWLSPKQHEVADEVQKAINIFLHGERQTGKDSAIAVGKFELLIKGNREHPIFFMASKYDTAIQIIDKILAEDRFEYILPFICKKFKDKVTFYNEDGGINTLQVIDTTEAAVKGITGDLWIDDVDTIIKNKKGDVITKAIMITRSNAKINLTFTSNMGKGAYISLLETWKDPKWKDEIRIMELTRHDVPHIIAEKDEFLFATATAISGEGEARAQLLNEYDTTGDIFDHNTLQNAFMAYEVFMAQRAAEIPVQSTILSIDPSGEGHPIGWCIFRFGNECIWEIDSGEIQMGSLDGNGQIWDINKIIGFFYRKCKQHFVKKAITESNSNGPAIAVSLRAKGIVVEMKNFGPEKSVTSHLNKIEVVKWFFDQNAIVIKSERLLAELRIYNPFIDKELHKGDVADSFIHCIYELCGGMQFLQKKIKEAAVEHSAEERDHIQFDDDDKEQMGYF